MNNGTGIGWFGIPGGPEWRSTKTHIVIQGKPVCGTRLGEEQEFQWCSYIGAIAPECRSCQRIRRSL
jgi:hypothetical protein